jgi:hypothetical protein
MSLDKIGAKRILNIDTDSSPQAQKCKTHFEQTRDALLRSHWWGFASAREKLSADTVTPDFEWDFQFILPADFLRMKSIYEDTISDVAYRSYAIEGDRLLSNESEMSIRYVKRITDPTKFDELFTELLVLHLALKLVSIAGANTKMSELLIKEIRLLEPRVRTVDAQETNTSGVVTSETWNNARFSGRYNDPSRY